MVEGRISSSGQVIVHDDEDLYCRGVCIHRLTNTVQPGRPVDRVFRALHR
jgi:hypothetical protein